MPILFIALMTHVALFSCCCILQVGEMYMAQALAIISDNKVICGYLVTPSVALFMFLITLLGGNTPLLVPLLEGSVGYQADVLVDFTAAAPYPSSSKSTFFF